MLRYVFFLALGLASLYAFIGATAGTSGMLLAEAGHTAGDSDKTGLTILAVAAAFLVMSTARFVMAGVKAIAHDWYERNKGRMYSLLLVGLLGGVFLVV